jgi:hypothetical protein
VKSRLLSDKLTELLATIHRLPISNPDVAINGLSKRYRGVQTLGTKLPSDDTIELPDSLDLSEIVRILPSGFLPPQSSQSEKLDEETSASPQVEHAAAIIPAALALAVFGWELDGDGSTGLLECKACFRRLGLWMYKPKANGELTVYSKLDVVEEHMDYCPWISGEAQSGLGRANGPVESLHSGWQVVIQSIRNKHRRLTRSASSENVNRDSDVFSIDDVVDEGTKKAKDREWWSKIRRVREALHVKAPKNKSKSTNSANDGTG